MNPGRSDQESVPFDRLKGRSLSAKVSLGLSLMGIVTLFVALRWNNLTLPWVRDEGEYGYAAQVLARGGLPYKDSFLQKPPMVVYAYALAHWLAPKAIWAPRLLACCCVGLATCLTGFVARQRFGPGSGPVAAWLLTPLVLMPEIQQFTANTEMFLLLPLMGMAAIALGRLDFEGRQPFWCALAGFLGATALLFKYTALPVVAWTAGLVLVAKWKATRSLRPVVTCAIWWAVGGLIASLVWLGPFIARGALPQLWECTVAFNRHYTSSSTFGWSSLLYNLKVLFAEWWIMFLLPVCLLIKPDRGDWALLGLFLAAWLATGASIYGHYYIVLMPFLALLGASAIFRVARFTSEKVGWAESVIRFAVTGVVVALLCWSHLPWIIKSRRDFEQARLGDQEIFRKSKDVAVRLAEITRPGDRVFIGGSEPQILYFAQRRSATRFVIMYPLMIPSPVAQQYQAEAIADLERSPPAAIVMMRDSMSWMRQTGTPPEFLAWLDRSLAEHYECVGGYVLDGTDRDWQGPFVEGILTQPTVTLYRPKRK